MAEPFLLSVLEPFAGWICDGRKLWEFRENPRFGRAGEHELAVGDLVFIVAMSERPEIRCACRVREILRDEEVRLRLGDRESEAWKQIGYAPQDQPWCILVEEILPRYRTAIRLEAMLLRRPLKVSEVLHAQTGRPWSGRGFLHASQLRRYRIGGMRVEQALTGLLAATREHP